MVLMTGKTKIDDDKGVESDHFVCVRDVDIGKVRGLS